MDASFKEALRAEIQRELMQGDFTAGVCGKVLRLTEAAREFLRATAPTPADFAEGTSHLGANDAPPALPSFAGAETFGARILRDLVPALLKMRERPENPEQLVGALVQAKANGLDAVAKALEARLTVASAPPPPVVLSASPDALGTTVPLPAPQITYGYIDEGGA